MTRNHYLIWLSLLAGYTSFATSFYIVKKPVVKKRVRPSALDDCPDLFVQLRNYFCDDEQEREKALLVLYGAFYDTEVGPSLESYLYVKQGMPDNKKLFAKDLRKKASKTLATVLRTKHKITQDTQTTVDIDEQLLDENELIDEEYDHNSPTNNTSNQKLVKEEASKAQDQEPVNPVWSFDDIAAFDTVAQEREKYVMLNQVINAYILAHNNLILAYENYRIVFIDNERGKVYSQNDPFSERIFSGERDTVLLSRNYEELEQAWQHYKAAVEDLNSLQKRFDIEAMPLLLNPLLRESITRALNSYRTDRVVDIDDKHNDENSSNRDDNYEFIV